MEVRLVRYTKTPVDAVTSVDATDYDDTNGRDMARDCSKEIDRMAGSAVFQFEISEISQVGAYLLAQHRAAACVQPDQQTSINICSSGFVIPPGIESNKDIRPYFWQAIETLRQAYILLIDSGVSMENARYILPAATKTKVHIAMNYRELRHFCKWHLCHDAHWEMKLAAEKMKELVSGIAPSLGRFLTARCAKCCCQEAEQCTQASTTIQPILV